MLRVAWLTAFALVFAPGRAPAAPPAATLSWNDVAASYAAVQDYTARYEKEERAIDNGEMQRIRLSFRKPLDVRLEWEGKDGKVDQTAVYRQGMNDGKLVARRSGMLGSMVGIVHLDPRGHQAMEDSRHPVTEVGLGFIIDSVTQEVAAGHATASAAADAMLDGSAVVRFDYQAAAGSFLLNVPGAVRAVVLVDPLLKLPLKVDLLDASGAMVERHRFKNLRTNVGLTDAVFTL